MGILGIRNRTENWKTARTFAPFFDDAELRLVLAEKLSEPSDTKPDDVHLELFWKGMRDYLNQGRKNEQAKLLRDSTTRKLVDSYSRLFPDLRKQIKGFRPIGVATLRLPEALNYHVASKNAQRDLGNNLVNTEIDLVLETPGHLYIGEAKHKMDFGRNGSLVLVHQRIRQYVVASILVELTGCAKEVVPFIVRNEPKGREPAQIQFMVEQGWLKKKNCLTWDDIEKLSTLAE